MFLAFEPPQACKKARRLWSQSGLGFIGLLPYVVQAQQWVQTYWLTPMPIPVIYRRLSYQRWTRWYPWRGSSTWTCRERTARKPGRRFLRLRRRWASTKRPNRWRRRRRHSTPTTGPTKKTGFEFDRTGLKCYLSQHFYHWYISAGWRSDDSAKWRQVMDERFTNILYFSDCFMFLTAKPSKKDLPPVRYLLLPLSLTIAQL